MINAASKYHIEITCDISYIRSPDSGLRDNDLLSNFDFHSHDESEFGSLSSKNETTSRETDKQKEK